MLLVWIVLIESYIEINILILAIAEIPTIFFDSHDVSKPDSVSLLSVLDDGEKCKVHPTISGEFLDRVMSMLRVALEMNLFGVDIVVEKNTGHYAIIDINAFPGTHPNNLNWIRPVCTEYGYQWSSYKATTDVTQSYVVSYNQLTDLFCVFDGFVFFSQAMKAFQISSLTSLRYWKR